MNFKEYYDAEMKKKNILNNESIIDKKINKELEKIDNSKQSKDKKLFVNPEISFKEILDKKDSRNELTENSKLKEENKEVKCEKEDKFKSAEKDDKALVPSNKIVNSSKFSPFTPINYLEEDALNERYMRFICSNEDPRKIIPSLDLGVIVDELNKRFKHFQKIRMKNNCQDKNVNLAFGEFQGTDLISLVKLKKYGMVPNHNSPTLGLRRELVSVSDRFPESVTDPHRSFHYLVRY
uniref:Uncharacterized protein n=1 Tax=Meloidogyne javanica TaxID=6303 RepID=A0A915LJX6_MELJA